MKAHSQVPSSEHIEPYSDLLLIHRGKIVAMHTEIGHLVLNSPKISFFKKDVA